MQVTIALTEVPEVQFTLSVPYLSKFLIWSDLNENYGLDLDAPSDFRVLGVTE